MWLAPLLGDMMTRGKFIASAYPALLVLSCGLVVLDACAGNVLIPGLEEDTVAFVCFVLASSVLTSVGFTLTIFCVCEFCQTLRHIKAGSVCANG